MVNLQVILNLFCTIMLFLAFILYLLMYIWGFHRSNFNVLLNVNKVLELEWASTIFIFYLE